MSVALGQFLANQQAQQAAQNAAPAAAPAARPGFWRRVGNFFVGNSGAQAGASAAANGAQAAHDAVNNGLEAARDAAVGGREWVSDKFLYGAASGEGKLAKTIAHTGTVAGVMEGPAKWLGKGVGKAAKFGGMAAAAVAGLGALAYFSSGSRSSQRFDANQLPPLDDLDKGLPPVMDFSGVTPGAETIMGMKPQPGALAEKVIAERNGTPMRGAINPRMNVTKDVQDLGSVPPTLAV
jgi:hypothetical protein